MSDRQRKSGEPQTVPLTLPEAVEELQRMRAYFNHIDLVTVNRQNVLNWLNRILGPEDS
ncbi:MAG: hypothetical protein KGJ23_08740 [Euryarchaeota archaeon]|nr:hypothetical protein [Euryarchaeota archaeon]MDE1836690.1 hypothetical protein [Euryarchaeota archaeon]MDE1880281.1 hypothetical protein [Euryarchaeota archaeon]MDE2044660.1 hypothetical protein [Thermoplasmata archaeon]